MIGKKIVSLASRLIIESQKLQLLSYQLERRTGRRMSASTSSEVKDAIAFTSLGYVARPIFKVH